MIDLIPIIAVVVTLAAVVVAAIAITRSRATREALGHTRANLEAERATAAEAVEKLAAALSGRTEARTRLQETEAARAELRAERNAAIADRDKAREALKEAEKQAALERQKREGMKEVMANWETAKQESLNHAKAAVLSTAHEVSSKLIADHKREIEAAKKASEQHVTKTTKTLNRQIEGVTKSVAALSDQVSRNRETVDTVWRALSNPAGAGHFSEVTLENTLKSFGFERDRDFVVEHTIEDALDGKRLRPDAVVFLPFESVLVIDSKASKFILELAQVEGTEKENEAYASLAKTMNQHLRALAGKDYKGAIVDQYRSAGRVGEIRRVLSVMYLPNDGALEKLKRADTKFDGKAARQGIIVAGPTGLASIIGFARIEIDLGRQAENQEDIVQATQQLLESIGSVMSHVDSVGKGIRTAANSYVRLTGSVNSRLLPRARGLAELGVRSAKGKPLPKQLAAYQVIDLSEHTTIEGEAEEVPSAMLIEESAAN